MEDLSLTPASVFHHILVKLRAQTTKNFAEWLSEISRESQKDNGNSETASRKLFVFQAAIVGSISECEKLSSTSERHEILVFNSCFFSTTLESLEIWTLRYALAKIGEGQPPVDKVSSHGKDEEAQSSQKTKHAILLARDGAYEKAAQALSPLGVLPSCHKTLEALKGKNPQCTNNIKAAVFNPSCRRSPLKLFLTEEVLAIIKMFKPFSPGGTSGLRPDHLKEMLKVTRIENGGPLSALTSVVNIFSAEKAPFQLAHWISGASYTLLSKPDGSPRLISVREKIRCVVSGLHIQRSCTKASLFFRPIHLGIATKFGAESLVHSIKATDEIYQAESRFVVLLVDLKNAFNLCNRTTFLNLVMRNFPEIFNWVAYCYHNNVSHLWQGSEDILSVLGVQQGDPLGPLLFCLVLRPILEELRELFSLNEDTEDCDEAAPLHQWYFDDGYLIATHNTIQNALRILSLVSTRKRWLHLFLDYRKVW